jgi:formylglycine-generating enzyme required for sulfatase activity
MRPFSALALVGSVVLAACSPQTEDKVTDTGAAFAFDLDADGFGAPADCDDAESAVNPLARDVAGDGLDADCDGADGVDRDGDGVASVASGGTDCDDESPARAPGQADVGVDGVDQDCSGLDGDDATPVNTDADGDGYDAVALGGVDCDDANAAINPAATDLAGDSFDQNCDGVDGFDGDRDGVAAGWSGGLDCDDTASGVNPQAADTATDGTDQDCSGVDGPDADGDGYPARATGGVDCDDAAAAVNPAGFDGAVDGVDDDCDGVDGNHAPAILEDLDGDGFSDVMYGGDDCDDRNAGVNPRVTDLFGDDVDQDCDGADGHDGDGDGAAALWTGGDDCDDADPTVFPGAGDRTVDGVDQDCSGLDGSADAPPIRDVDGDGFVAANLGGDDCDDRDAAVNVAVFDRVGDAVDANCDGVDGHDEDGDGVGAWWSLGRDCDDGDALVRPGATDVTVDGTDQDCDGFDGRDADHDGEAAATVDTLATGGTDCDDTDATVNTRAVDATVDQRDQDCDGVDGNDAAPPADADRDGFVAHTDGGPDCDDGNAALNPAATDSVGDGLDQNCDGTDGVDADHDGVASLASGGRDCDDTRGDTKPGAADSVGDTRDQDCDGLDGVDADGDHWPSLASGGADCDDAAAGVNPAASDRLGDTADADCDGVDGTDLDEDGVVSVESGGTDCDDRALDAYPGATDTAGDARDQDCDGVDGVDADRDGAASLASGGGDCNDANASIHPGAADTTADGVDQDCVGGDANDAVRDLDGDGFVGAAWGGSDCDDGNAAINPAATDLVGDRRDQNCDGPDGYDADRDGFAAVWSGGTDCDDDATDDAAGHPGAAAVHPGSLLDAATNGVDEDCDGLDGPDGDGDGYADADFGGTDCDDARAEVHPGASDTSYDGLNQDCAGLDGTGAVRDLDGDGHEAIALGGDDCNDRNAAINPSATDLADDTIDQNCDGTDGTDRDGDGYASVVSGGTDCDDTRAAVHPGASDHTVDGLNQDCAGVDGVDMDGDGFASEASGGSDCDDTDADVSPAGFDLWVDGTDQDCDDQDGDGIEPAGLDEDRDGFVSEAEGGRDCDDHRSGISPVASDMWGDDIDQNCDGADGTDADRDGQISVASGGLDCLDTDPTVYAGAAWRERVELQWRYQDGDSLSFALCTRDEDGDGWGDDDYLAPRQYIWIVGETRQPRRGHDCQDGDALISPSQLDWNATDGVDSNCDGSDADDNDGDGYADVAVGGDDCGDRNARVHPDRLDPLVCGWDQDADGYVGSLSWPNYEDNDSGYAGGDTGSGSGWSGGTTGCDTGLSDSGAGCDPAHQPTDCLDTNSEVYPGSLPNEGATVCAPDFDGDGWGSQDWGGSDCVDWGLIEGAHASGWYTVLFRGEWANWAQHFSYWELLELSQYAQSRGEVPFSASVHPGAAAAEPYLCTQDADGDGFGSATGELVVRDSVVPRMWWGQSASMHFVDTGMDAGTDCDDDAAALYPDAAENEAPGTCMADVDGDGWGDRASGGHDCDDSDSGVVPQPETCNDVDDDCDGVIDNDTTDADGDSYTSCNDCDDSDPLRAFGDLTWSPVWSHDLAFFPGGELFNGGWMYQGNELVYGRHAWVQNSDWNTFWIPVERSTTGIEAVEVEVQVPDHSTIHFFPRTSFSGDNHLFVEGGRTLHTGYRTRVYHDGSGSGTSTGTSYEITEDATVATDLPGPQPGAWHRLRVETYEHSNTTTLFLDGAEIHTTRAIPLAGTSGDAVLLAAFTDCCGNPAGVAWSNLTVYEGVEGPSGVCAADGDRDGFDAIAAGGTDCDDTDADIRPDAVGLVCGHDRDHDGHVDDADGGTDCDDENALLNALDDLTGVCGADADLDGFVAEADGGTDCNDGNETIRPGAAAREPALCTRDADGDGWGDASLGDGSGGDTGGDTGGTFFGIAGTDCDDTRAAVNPAAAETCNGLDDNCDGVPDEGMPDIDGDGAADCIDCAPNDPAVSPFRAEVCDTGVDNDCDPGTDEAADGDGDGYALCDGDCDDAAAQVHPDRWGAACGIDADGDGDVRTQDGGTDCDDGNAQVTGDRQNGACGPDADHDGYMAEWAGGTDCDDSWDAAHPGAAYNEPALCTYDLDGDGWGDRWYRGTDCDDGDVNVFPVPETCNGLDDDCNGVVDDVDADDDGFTLCAGDCDDTDPARFPGNPEACDGGVDNDCDATTDENVDRDGDGATICQDDCDDSRAVVHPGAVDGGANGDVCDGLDNDCDGLVDETTTCQACTETLAFGASYMNCAGTGWDNWYEARSMCQALGGDLAAAETYGESAFIASVTVAWQGLGWVGGFVDVDAQTVLVTGEPFRFVDVYNDHYFAAGAGLLHYFTWHAPGVEWLWLDASGDGADSLYGYQRGFTCERPALDTDADGDGYLDMLQGGTDCDDQNPLVHPDVDGWSCGLDADDDGQVREADGGHDCDDNNPAAALRAMDADCDGIVIELDSMALIPAGSFDMGCTPGQADCRFNEFPVMPVTLTRGYYIGPTEVTQTQFALVMGYNPSARPCAEGDCPVEQVSWHEAAAFANAASAAEGLAGCYACFGSGASVACTAPSDPYACAGYRLPTEAEWEGAARCGTDVRYAGSDTIDDVAWWRDNSGYQTQRVGLLAANACGLYDMSGNVWEWVDDAYDDTLYTADGRTDPVGTDVYGYRSFRGGAFANPATEDRVSYREGGVPGLRDPALGFRLARTAPAP